MKKEVLSINKFKLIFFNCKFEKKYEIDIEDDSKNIYIRKFIEYQGDKIINYKVIKDLLFNRVDKSSHIKLITDKGFVSYNINDYFNKDKGFAFGGNLIHNSIKNNLSFYFKNDIGIVIFVYKDKFKTRYEYTASITPKSFAMALELYKDTGYTLLTVPTDILKKYNTKFSTNLNIEFNLSNIQK